MRTPQQIQSWPTPEIFIKRGGVRRLTEAPRENFKLDHFHYAEQISESQTEATNLAAFSLDEYLVPGPVNRSVSDNDNEAFELDAMVHRIMITESDSDNDNELFALASMKAGLPILQSETENTIAPLFALSSMVINP